MAERSRRDFLKLTGGAAIGAGAAASISPGVAAALERMGASASQAGIDWAALQAELAGTVLRPSSPGWAPAIELFNTVFGDIVPQAVAYCASPADVAAALRFARANGLEMRARNGRHSYGGYSTCEGLIIDVTDMADIEVGPGATTARIGAGALIIDVYTALAVHGVTIPSGTCASIGVTGVALGGGQGETSRAFGMTCDALVEVEIVTADGEILTASATQHPDLLWACQGGGGGNFGIVTRLTFRTFPITNVTTFDVAWPWTDAAAVMAGWQAWLPTLPDELFSGLALLSSEGGPGASPYLGAAGTFIGDEAALDVVLAPLLAVGTPAAVTKTPQTWTEAFNAYAGCASKTLEQCHPTYWNPPGQLPQNTWKAKSLYFGEPLPADGIAALVAWIDARQADPLQPTTAPQFGTGGIGFDSYGGAINRVAPDATAFVHRDSLFHGQFLAYWYDGAPAGLVDDNLAWIAGFFDAMTPYGNGESYQNYIDPDLPDWLHAYYGSNLPRLQEIKRAYDPEDVFRFAQSIPPAPAPPTPTSSTTQPPAPAPAPVTVAPTFTG